MREMLRWVLFEERRLAALGPGSRVFEDVLPKGHMLSVYHFNTPEDSLGFERLRMRWIEDERRYRASVGIAYQPIGLLFLFGFMRLIVGYDEGLAWEAVGACAVSVACYVLLRSSVLHALNVCVCAGRLLPVYTRYHAWVLLSVWQKRGYPWHAVQVDGSRLGGVLLATLDEVRLTQSTELYDASGNAGRVEVLSRTYDRQRCLWIYAVTACAYLFLIALSVRWIFWIMKPLSDGVLDWDGG